VSSDRHRSELVQLGQALNAWESVSQRRRTRPEEHDPAPDKSDLSMYLSVGLPQTYRGQAGRSRPPQPCPYLRMGRSARYLSRRGRSRASSLNRDGRHDRKRGLAVSSSERSNN
jgi:hypothetical protein